MRRINITHDGITLTMEAMRVNTETPELYDICINASNGVTASITFQGESMADIRDVIAPMVSLLELLREKI